VRWLGAEDGATAIEYAMIASIVSIVIVTGVTTIGTKLTFYFSEVIAPYLHG
jgi:pilus assembly protein Flp/PilA